MKSDEVEHAMKDQGLTDMHQPEVDRLRESGVYESTSKDPEMEAYLAMKQMQGRSATPAEDMDWVKNNMAVPDACPNTAPSGWAYAILMFARKNDGAFRMIFESWMRIGAKRSLESEDRMSDDGQSALELIGKLEKGLA